MPTLPTVDVTQEQADRIMAAFAAKYGTSTPAETADAYRRELLVNVVNTVIEHEAALITEQQRDERAVLLQQVRETLPDPMTMPATAPEGA